MEVIRIVCAVLDYVFANGWQPVCHVVSRLDLGNGPRTMAVHHRTLGLAGGLARTNCKWRPDAKAT
jgi:hypothetical protein